MFQKFIFQMLLNCLAAASPEVVKAIREAIAKMAEDAKKTSNPWDDIFFALLQLLIGKPGEPVEET